MENPQNYGFQIQEEDLYPVIPYNEIEISEPVPDFAGFAKSYGMNYKILKDFNPWLREPLFNQSIGKKIYYKNAGDRKPYNPK